jgi:dienelactone hydrolase
VEAGADSTTRELFELQTPAGRRLHGVLDLPASSRPAATIVCAHGFKGFMEYGFFPYLAELLAARGFVVVRFNFSSAGMRPGDERVTDAEAFKRGLISEDRAELLAVLDAVAGGSLARARVDPTRLGLLGHSRGGGAAVLAAAEPACRDRIGALVTWAAISTHARFPESEQRIWRERGEYPILNARTGQLLGLGVEVLDDVLGHLAELDILAAAGRRKAPWLILHGDVDETVPVDEARALFAAAQAPRELHIVSGGDHGLGGRHPFQGPRPPVIEAMNLTQRWFRRYLAPRGDRGANG